MRLKVYRGSNVAFALDGKQPLRQVRSAKHKKALMQDDTITVSVDAVDSLHLALRDHIVYDGKPYFLNLWPEVKKTGRRVFSHTLKLEGGMFELGRVIFTMGVLNGWDFYGTLYEYCCLVVREMNRACYTVFGNAGGQQKLFHYNGIQGGKYWYQSEDGTVDFLTDDEWPTTNSVIVTPLTPVTITATGGLWSLDFETETVDGKVIPVPTEEKQMTYDSHSCLAVVQDLCNTWEEWEFEVIVRQADLVTGDFPTRSGGTLVMRRKQTGFGGVTGIVNASHTLSYGKSGGITELTRKQDGESNIPTRVYFYGGSQNVPASYRCTRICLPYVSKEKSFLPDDGSLNAGNRLCEAVKVFDDIFPANRPFSILGNGELPQGADTEFVIKVSKSQFFDLFAKWKDPNDSTSQYGTFGEWRKSYGTDDAAADLQRYILHYYQGDAQEMQPGFPKSCYLTSNEGVTLTFQTGDLAGYAFKIKDFDTLPEYYYEIRLIKQGVESVYGDEVLYIPNSENICHAGDQFIIEDCLMPPTYTYYQGAGDDFSAEGQLLLEAYKYINTIGDGISFDAKPGKEYVINKMAENAQFAFRVFDSLTLDDSDIASGYANVPFRIDEVERNLLDEITYTMKLSRMIVRGSGGGGKGATGVKEVLRQLMKQTENARKVIKSPTVSRGTAAGQHIFLNGVDVTDDPIINIIDATSQWFGSQAAYNELVENNQIQPNVAYHVLPQPDWNETDPNHLGYIKNKPNIMDMEVEDTTANFFYQ